MFYISSKLKNLTQGERLAFVREFRHMDQKDTAAYFGFNGIDSPKTIREYENNRREPGYERLQDLADLYEVNVNAIKKYDFKNPIDLLYIMMWMEEIYPYYEINYDYSCCKSKEENSVFEKGVQKWQEMRDMRDNYEISDDEYLDWKLNFEIDS